MCVSDLKKEFRGGFPTLETLRSYRVVKTRAVAFVSFI